MFSFSHGLEVCRGTSEKMPYGGQMKRAIASLTLMRAIALFN